MGTILGPLPLSVAFDSVRLVKDISDGAPRTSVAGMVFTHGDGAYFVADTPGRGRTLWRTDGTEAGTVPVFPHGTANDIVRIAPFGDRFLIHAWFDGYGNELGEFDPATGQIRLVKDTIPGPESAFMPAFVAANELCYFLGGDATTGLEFWRTDGTEPGTFLVEEIVPGPGDAWASFLLYPIAALGNRLIAFADDGTSGTEPWLIDGVTGEVRLVRDVRPGSSSSIRTSSAAVSLPGHVLFIASETSSFNYEVWSTDGTEAGTVPLTNGADMQFSQTIIRIGDHAYFIVDGDAIGVRHLMRSDGTAVGTTIVDLSPSGPPIVNVRSLAAFGDELAMMVSAGSGLFDLWLTDLTPVNTRRIAAGFNNRLLESFPATASGRTYFVASTAAEGSEPWVTDGTAAGTHLAADINRGVAPSFPNQFYRPPSGDLTQIGTTVAELVFCYADDGTRGREPWASDGTAPGTQMLRNIQPEDGLMPSAIHSSGERVFFVGTDAATGSELWVSDGSAAGTSITRDVRPGPASGSALFTIAAATVADRFYLPLDDGEHGLEPWGSDGTAPGTYLVADLQAGSLGPAVRHLAEFDGRLVIVTGLDVYLSDGTPETTELAVDLPDGASISSAMLPGGGLWDGLILLSATVGDTGQELWLGNLRTGDLTPLADIDAGPGSSAPFFYDRFGERVLFSATSPATGRELWITDGSPSGTSLVSDVRPGPADSAPGGVMVLTARVLFFADDGLVGYEPWVTDGTPQGTSRVMDIYPGPIGSFATSTVTAHNGVAYFAALSPELGTEPWRSDGTPAGTAVLRDIVPGARSSRPDGFEVHGSFVYFAAEDDVSGRELWRTDGTPAGTLRVADLRPGPGGALTLGTNLFASAGQTLYFSANDGRHGQELWVLESESSPDIDGDGVVGLQDLALLLSGFGSCGGQTNYTLAADLDDSGCVEIADLAQILSAFGS